jgi:hypothetical protein
MRECEMCLRGDWGRWTIDGEEEGEKKSNLWMIAWMFAK